MPVLDDIADAVWTYEPRALAGGVAGAPSGGAEEVADAVWTYDVRTLTEVAGGSRYLILRHVATPFRAFAISVG